MMTRKQQTIDSTATRGAAKPVKSFVSAGVPAPVQKPRRPLPDQTRHERVIKTTPRATTAIIVKTSERDRAQAFIMRTSVLAFVAAVGMVVLSSYNGWIAFFSVATLAFFFGTFATAWTIAYLADAFVSPVGVALFEAFSEKAILFYDIYKTWEYRNRE